MTLAILFRPEAELDLIETRDWYERQQVGLGEAFANSVDETVDRIEAKASDVRRGIPRHAQSQASKVPLPGLLSRVIRAN